MLIKHDFSKMFIVIQGEQISTLLLCFLEFLKEI